MLQFLKYAVVKDKEGAELVAVKCTDADNWLPVNEVDVGVVTSLALSKVKKDNTRKELRYAFRQSLSKIVTYMQTTPPVTNPVLRDLSCLQPSVRKLEPSKSMISRLCLHLKKITRMNDVCDKLQTEWLLF